MTRQMGLKHGSKFKNFYILLLLVVICGLLVTGVLQFWPHVIDDGDESMLHRNKRSVIHADSPKSNAREVNCSYHSCFEVHRCGTDPGSRISVYVYPQEKYVDSDGMPVFFPPSHEFLEIVKAIQGSEYITHDPGSACLLVPFVDFLNQNNLRLEQASQVLASHHGWSDGANHLLFNMLPGTVPDYHSVLEVDHGKAIILGGGFSSWTYRPAYDVSIPVYNPLLAHLMLPHRPVFESRRWLLASFQLGLHSEYQSVLKTLAEQHNDVIVSEPCGENNYTQRCYKGEVFEYPHALQDCTFCVITRGTRLGQPDLSDALRSGCIPVIVADSYVLPFSEVLDWKRASLVVREQDLDTVYDVVKQIPTEEIYALRKQVTFFWESYFHSIKAITLTSLQIIQDRVFPYAAKPYEDWNELPFSGRVKNPLFVPLTPSHAAGFTAVLLTYDRLESLFRVITQVAKTPSLSKVLVIWNNQVKQPPPASSWPKINKPLQVIKTKRNKLSTRFFPYDEIETDCVLALDDDIVMLTADEMEFGYQVWREFPDRLVGFPSRLHLWDNSTSKWKYESEWTNEISIVLTGAAFYHKHFNYLYTNTMPSNIKTWVDDHMNCEDIAMNFLITNRTGKAPLKVTPRKKFKCPECINTESLSVDTGYMVERSECINTFSDAYGMVPLKTVEYRADPVLFKDQFPNKLKQFSDIGSL